MRLVLALAVVLAACREPRPEDAEAARLGMRDRAEAQPDTIADLISPRVPRAVAGDTGWSYAERVSADFDRDGSDETAVLISDVTLDKQGRPLWEDGHRWQLYVQEGDGRVTRLYARFLPNGKLTAKLGASVFGGSPSIVLIEETPDHLGVYEFHYSGPGRSEVYSRLDRALDGRGFLSAP